MNVKESLMIVQIIHNAYPYDRKASNVELMERAKTYQVAMADEDFETVKEAAESIIKTSKWLPNVNEILEAVKRVKLANITQVTPIHTAEPIADAELEEYIEAFCEWLGFDGEPNDSALDEYYEKHPERLEVMRRWLKYEE